MAPWENWDFVNGQPLKCKKSQVGSSRQLFETVNFVFMKFFDFLVKTAIFGAFLLFIGWFMSQITAEIERGG